MNKIKSKLPSNTRFIRVLWCDNANIIRGKALNVDALKILDSENSDISVGISRAQQGVPVIYDGVVDGSGLDPVGEIKLQADMSTLTNIPYAPGHVRVMGDMVENNQAWGNCPRGFLKRMISNLSHLNLEIKSAFENEFYLLDGDEFKASDRTPFASTQAMDIHHEIISEILESLKAQGIVVEQYYPESGPGQHEITMVYDEPLNSADKQIIFRETVKAISPKHGLRASFLPKIFPDKAGNGCHLHLSLWNEGENILYDSQENHGLSLCTQQFIAGLIYHLPSLMAITTPISRSYQRIVPRMWSGAYQVWGFNNREAAIRVIKEDNGHINHLEFKTMDASSNPYLALGAVIAAGMDGIKEEMALIKPVQKDPATLSLSEREDLGIELLPTDIGEALDNLKKNRVLLNAMGKDLSKSYLAVKNEEYEALSKLSAKEEIDLLLEKY